MMHDGRGSTLSERRAERRQHDVGTQVRLCGDIIGAFAIVSSIEHCYPPFESQSHGFLLRGGDFTVLEDFPGSSSTEPTGINDDGVMIGRYTDSRGKRHGFRATPIP